MNDGGPVQGSEQGVRIGLSAVVIALRAGQTVVLTTHAADGAPALPFGPFDPARDRTFELALRAFVTEQTGFPLGFVEQLYTFDTIDRDPRGPAVSVTYMGCGREVALRDAGAHVAFLDVDNLPDLAYDHANIIAYARERLIAKLTYTNAVSAFLEKRFTLTQLQSAYEIIFGREFDKRNFRKKFLSLNLIHETDELWRDGAHRPAKLYEFNSQTLESLSRSFD